MDIPFEIEDVEKNLANELMQHYTGELSGFVRVGPKGYFLPQKYKAQASDIYNIPIRPDDIFVVTYPRSGTTWTQELVWLVKNDFDFETAKTTPIAARFPYLEFSILVHPVYEQIMRDENKIDPQRLRIVDTAVLPSAEKVAKIPSPRFIKSHLPLSLLPPTLLDTAKVVYVARDPRDAAVSHYHLSRLYRIQGAPKDFKTYWNYLIRGLHHFSPILEHVKEAWRLRNHPNLLFVFYEELSKDLPSVVRRISKFLGKSPTAEQVGNLCEHLSFNNFKDNSAVNEMLLGKIDFLNKGEAPFIRKGKVGGWREYFDDEMMQQADRWLLENLTDTDLRFPSWDLPQMDGKGSNPINVEYIRATQGRT
ncbi:sulfotransferase 1C4 [Pieris rapae]|uniref:sulfotransferase 1C4 n=1 Tax=Pieris rapae TaxID=64459 RepID=UPI001E27A1DF|nr:sulfotransferase 1C4 [Pieris rapae]